MRYYQDQRAFSRAQAAYEDRMPDDNEAWEREEERILEHLETSTDLSDYPSEVVDGLVRNDQIYCSGEDACGNAQYFEYPLGQGIWADV